MTWKRIGLCLAAAACLDWSIVLFSHFESPVFPLAGGIFAFAAMALVSISAK